MEKKILLSFDTVRVRPNILLILIFFRVFTPGLVCWSQVCLKNKESGMPSGWQPTPSSNWKSSPEMLPGKIKAFEENRGQYSNPVNDWKVLYACFYEGFTILFTEHGIIYTHKECKKNLSRETSNDSYKKRERFEEEEVRNYKTILHQVTIEWEGANAKPVLEAKEPTSFYFCSSDPADPSKGIGPVPGFKTLVYHELYPGLDLEFTFHPKQGIKYVIRSKPGSDASAFVMKYAGSEGVSLDNTGNIHIKTFGGDLLDHAPTASFLDGSPVPVSFERKGLNRIGFKLAEGAKTRGLIIDPWLVTPTTGGFDPSNLGTDASNNVYVYGMTGGNGFNNLTYLQKYSPVGALLWTYTANQFPATSLQADLAVDPAGNSYMAAPFTYTNAAGNQYALLCINTSGVQSYFYNTYASNNISETWNLAYSCNYSTIIQAGCGQGANDFAQVTLMTPANGNVGQQYSNQNIGEVYAGTVAPNGNYYALAADSNKGSGPYNDLLCFTITGATVSLSYKLPIDYAFTDFQSKMASNSIGTNGIAAGCGFLYTSDGKNLDQRSLTTGALIKRVTIAGTPIYGFNINSGLAVDLACGNVYAGSEGSVFVYDANLNLVGSYTPPLIPAGGIVYDVSLNKGIVSVCGADSVDNGFVAQFPAKICTNLITLTHTNASCGLSNGTATALPTFCIAPYSYLWTPSGQTNATATGLAPGLYTVSVNTQNSCAAVSDTVTIFSSSNLIPAVSTTPTTCGGANGSATASVTGSTGTLTYSWSTNPVQTGAAISNMPAGTYTVTVTTASGCSGSATCIIKNSSGGSVTIAPHTNVSCNGGNNGSATAVLAGGIKPITYSWTPSGDTAAVASNLSAGIYTVTAKDSSGCISTDTITIVQPSLLTLSVSSTPSNCSGPTGTASASVSGGAGAYTFSWSPAGGSTANATALSPGTYAVTVKDANACSKTVTVVVTSTSSITASIQSSANVSCYGGNTGAVTGVVTGGHPAYTYSWSPAGGNTAIASGLTAGVYTLTVKDSSGCISTALDTIHQPAILALSVTGSKTSCFGSCNGIVSVVASGGTTPYTYLWSTGATTSTSSALCVGNYTIQVTDKNGCTKQDSAMVKQPAALNLSMFSTTSRCNRPNGSDSVWVSGGTKPYSYSWSPGPGSATSSYPNLGHGTFTVTVKDSANCSATDTLTVPATPPVVASIPSSANITCFGDHNGYAVAGTSGGTSPFTFSWSNSGGSLDTAKNLGPGTYTLTLTDSKGCQSIASVTLIQPTQVTVVPASPRILCIGQCTSLSAVGAGGTPGYTYSWTSASGNAASPVCPTLTTAYTVVATDSKGCISDPQVVIIHVNPPLEVLAGIPATICEGGSEGITCAVSGGDGVYHYTWLPATGLSSANVQNPVASPSSTTTYTVIVSDNCGTTTDSAFVTITVNLDPVLSFTANDTSGCAPLCVTFTASSNPACASASWTFGDGHTGAGCSGVNHCFNTPGSYGITWTVTDVNGCKSALNKPNYIHTYPVPIAAFSDSPQPTSILDPNIFFTDLSLGAQSWLWNFGDLNDGTSILQNPTYSYLDTGCYKVTLFVKNSYGCSDITSSPVCIQPIFTFYAPDAFTPNGDGINEVWMPKGEGIDPKNYHLMLFDRWGNLMFETYSWGQGWDGRANNGTEVAQIDTYVWKVDLTDVLHHKHQYIGHCNIIK